MEIFASINKKKPFKIASFFLGIFLLCLQNSWGQQTGLSTKISFPKQSYTVYELTQTIQHQADISFSYNSSKIKSNTTIQIQQKQTDLGKLLFYLKKEYGIVSRVQGNHVIFVPGPSYEQGIKQKKEVKQLAKKRRQQQKHAEQAEQAMLTKKEKENQKFVNEISQQSISVQSSQTDLEQSTSDHKNMESYLVEVLQEDEILLQYYLELGDKDKQQSTTNSLTQQRADNVNNALVWKTNDLLANIVLFADENFYFNPQIELGYKYIYITGAYAIGNGLNHWRYGGGVSIPINKDFSAGVFANYGRYAKTTDYYFDLTPPTPDPPDDSTEVEIPDPVIYEGNYAINASLFKLGIQADYLFNSKFSITFSLIWNNQYAQISNSGKPASVNSLFPANRLGMKSSDFDLLKNHPVPINNDFTFNRSSYSQSWIGIQIGLRFRFLN